MKDYLNFFSILLSDFPLKHINLLNNQAKNTICNKGKFLLAGNGGSMAIAEHIAAELTGRYKKNRIAIPAYVLASNVSSMSSISNDFNFEEVFIREIKAFLKNEDFVILMTTSGKSKNILKIVEYLSSRKNQNAFLLTGKDDIDIKLPSNITQLKAPVDITARIQEYHLFILHEMCRFIDTLFD